MKVFRIICFALLAALYTNAGAAGKVKSKNKKKAEVEKPDTVSVDLFSYACGKANTQGLKLYLAQRLGMDTTYMEDFMKGFDEVLLTEEDRKAKARIAGKEIRTQVETQIIPNVNKQISDSAEILVHKQFIQGFRDGLLGANMNISMDSIQKIVSKQAAYYQKEILDKRYGANRLAGEEFLKLNAKKDGVKTTSSGLQYKEIVTGTGEKPQPTHRVKVHYEGRLIDGTIFDSSYQRNEPVTFSCGQVIKGWTEALTLMPVGSKWELYIPQELGYGSREQGKIPPFSALIFTVELLGIEK